MKMVLHVVPYNETQCFEMIVPVSKYIIIIRRAKVDSKDLLVIIMRVSRNQELESPNQSVKC